jgi:hypothetical protein
LTTINALHDLELTPYGLELKEMRLVKRYNDHDRLTFTGIVYEGRKDKYINMTEDQTQIELKITGAAQNTKPLFRGIVLDINIQANNDVYYLTVEAISNTYQFDVRRKSRTFQNIKLTYRDLLKQVLADTSGADFRDSASGGATTGKFILQYNETDWQFCKRMASRFHAGLIPDHSSDKPKFFFGLPEGGRRAGLESSHYSVHRRLHEYRNAAENYISGIGEADYTVYEVESGQIVEVGSEVDFNGQTLYVKEAVTEAKQGLVTNLYSITTAKGLSQNDIYNSQISGVSLPGKVIDRSRDMVRVHLDIDQKQHKEEAVWFSYVTNYSTEGHSGWYCMPEIEDQIRLYFPSRKEEEAVVTSSVRQDLEESATNKVSNPDIKIFRTKSGKELKFSPEEIVITGKDDEVFLRINEKTGIEISSVKPVKIVSQAEINMESQQKIVLTAADEINISCKESGIWMDGETNIKGSKVKTN